MGRVMGISPFYAGARARLIQRVSRAYELAQDAPGVVVGVDYHLSEGANWVEGPTPEVWRAGVVALKYMPRTIHVAFDDHVPPGPISETATPPVCMRRGR